MAARGNNSAAELAVYADRFVPAFDDGYVQVFENPRALPRAHLVPCGGIEVQEFQRRDLAGEQPGVRPHADGPGRHDRLPRRSVVAGRTGAVGQPTEVIQATFNTYVIRADVAVPSLLVYADTYYEGWRGFTWTTAKSRSSGEPRVQGGPGRPAARRPLRLRPVDVPLGRRDHAGGAGDRGGAARLVRLAPDAAAGGLAAAVRRLAKGVAEAARQLQEPRAVAGGRLDLVPFQPLVERRDGDLGREAMAPWNVRS